nr:hypothetical protein B0A51_09234 [Rachicladosporium sp. CCFEE 5018]
MCGAKDKPLRKCAKCKYIQYCDNTCQTADWPAHKLHCKNIAELFAAYPNGQYTGVLLADVSTCSDREEWHVRRLGAASTGSGIKLKAKPFTALQDGTFLHDLPRIETFKLLIDCMRLWQEDCQDIVGHVLRGSIHSGESTSNAAFMTFIRKFRDTKLLPASWENMNTTFECVRFSQVNEDFSLADKRTFKDIQTAWGDDDMPNKLRLLVQRAHGMPPFPRLKEIAEAESMQEAS